MPRTLLVVDLTNIAVRCSLGGVQPAPRAADVAINMTTRVASAIGATHLVCAVDPAGASWRRQILPEYKAGRSLDTQPYSVAAAARATAEGWTVLSVDGFEADDVIATVTQRAAAHFDVVIFSGDSDVAQLVRPGTDLQGSVVQCWPVNGGSWELRDHAAIVAHYTVPSPARLVDMKAIAGEPGDNLPGMAGRLASGAVATRPALARKLLAAFGSLEGVIDAGAQNASREARSCYLLREQLRLTRHLATLRTDAPIPALRPSRCALPFAAGRRSA